MKREFKNLTAIEYSNPKLMNDYGYKYCIGYLGCGICQAYRTDSGFEKFLQVYNIEIDYVEVQESITHPGETVKIYHFKPFEIIESGFWNIEDVKDMNSYIGLCNCSYVVCYYKHFENGCIIMKPNPNAKMYIMN